MRGTGVKAQQDNPQTSAKTHPRRDRNQPPNQPTESREEEEGDEEAQVRIQHQRHTHKRWRSSSVRAAQLYSVWPDLAFALERMPKRLFERRPDGLVLTNQAFRSLRRNPNYLTNWLSAHDHGVRRFGKGRDNLPQLARATIEICSRQQGFIAYDELIQALKNPGVVRAPNDVDPSVAEDLRSYPRVQPEDEASERSAEAEKKRLLDAEAAKKSELAALIRVHQQVEDELELVKATAKRGLHDEKYNHNHANAIQKAQDEIPALHQRLDTLELRIKALRASGPADSFDPASAARENSSLTVSAREREELLAKIREFRSILSGNKPGAILNAAQRAVLQSSFDGYCARYLELGGDPREVWV